MVKYRKGPLSIGGWGGGGRRGATSTNMMRMLNQISTCDRMEVTRVSLTFTTLQGGTERGNEPLEFNDGEVQEGSIEHRGLGGEGEQGCNQHEHDEDAQPDQRVR